MKRLTAFILTFAFLFSIGLTGCNNTTEPASRYPQELMALINAPNKAYTLSEDTFKKDDVSIVFPVLQGQDSHNANEAILAFAQELADYYLKDWPTLVLPVTSKVTLQNDEIISIVFTGEGNFEGAAHPFSLFVSLNLQVKDGTKVSLGDYQTLDQEYLDLIFEYPVEGSDTEAVSESKSYINQEREDGTLDSMDSLDSTVFSYFTPTTVGISLPTIHALGDHLEFEIPYTA